MDAFRVEVGGQVLTVVSLPAPPSTEALSPAERIVLEELLRGRSNVEIARARRTSARTIANQVARIFEKLGVRSRRELAARMKGP
jgi:DNA-binding CsgD family transcriptional regulator